MTVTRDEWLRALNLVAPTDDPNAMTTSELAALLGIDSRRARERLSRLVADGKATRVTKVIRTPAGVAIRLPAYRLNVGALPTASKKARP